MDRGDHGEPGERYIAAGTNLTNRELVEVIRRVSGMRKPMVKLPLTAARTVARVMDAHARRTGAPPLLAREMFEYSVRPAFFRNDKARRELGAEFRPIEQTIHDAIAYFRGRGLIAA